MTNCICGDLCQTDGRVYESAPLAMSYTPVQVWRNIYCAQEGFCRGTIFAELDLPFFTKGGAL